MDPNDDEAPKDPGSTRQYTEKDYEGELNFNFHLRYLDLIPSSSSSSSFSLTIPLSLGHRAHTVFVGLHIPGSGKRHSHRRHRHHQKSVDGASNYEQNDFNLRPSEFGPNVVSARPVNNPGFTRVQLNAF